MVTATFNKTVVSTKHQPLFLHFTGLISLVYLVPALVVSFLILLQTSDLWGCPVLHLAGLYTIVDMHDRYEPIVVTTFPGK